MTFLRVITACAFLTGGAWAADGSAVSVGAPSVLNDPLPASAMLPADAIPHNSRMVVLVVGVAAVLVTFQRALTNRKKSA